MARLYYPLSIEGIEDVEDYRPGGFHPVHLGDVYEERYRVLLKLGAGGYSTTWLAHDSVAARYVALKIVKASETSNCVERQTHQSLSSSQSGHPGRAHVRCLLAHFTITGPNGNHFCLVSEVAGPTLPSLYENRESLYARRLRAAVARKISKQVAQAVGFLHSSGIGHGGKSFVSVLSYARTNALTDITVPNILLKLKSIDEWTEKDIYERFGQPCKEEPRMVSGLSLGPSAPRYIVEAARVPEERFLAEEVFLIDLGVSFPLKDPPRPQDIGVPLMYRAPETIFESRYDKFSDLWSLACVIFEIRAGTPIFESFMGTEDEIIKQWVQMKGKMPEPWWSSWDTRSSAFDESGKPLPRGPDAETWTNEYPLEEMIADIGEDDNAEENETADDAHIQQKPSLLELAGTRITKDEAASLNDLLGQMFQWKPDDRISVEQILEHPWFA
ncbi:uncharacterized protein MYCGRDRAFT_42881 [Zymoseptoria tritici IPO323]|uniref:non-specific serine/threonine protein kinase n=1 Tax=Zymoseptoria tritici (strain CBS 115943 / IPO323) TaxID=336722 RepID=F9XBZ6_ZYMTI|nr:uncharacterized protein MYCGRDRAFT_42881 [Zymoseptoria tritici IPO323]EGP87145.1 hypothetical protein MYCGRDRAFT_42881 [Zymoseptoria tritici IPO323]